MRRRLYSGSRISSTCCAGWTITKSGANRKEHRNKNARGKSRHRLGLCRMNRPLWCLLASHAPCIMHASPHISISAPSSQQASKQASARSFCRASPVISRLLCLCAWQKRDKKWPVSMLMRPKIFLLLQNRTLRITWSLIDYEQDTKNLASHSLRSATHHK